MSEQGETSSQKSEGMYSYKSDNNNYDNNINNNNNNMNNNIPKFESEAIRRSINDMNNLDQNKPQRNLNPTAKNFFPSGSIKEKDNYLNGTLPYRSSQISVVIPPESPLHWSFVLIYIILEVKCFSFLLLSTFGICRKNSFSSSKASSILPALRAK